MEEKIVEEKVKKSKKGVFITIILMLLMLGIGIGGSYYYFEIMNNDKEDSVEEKVEEKEEVVEEVKLSPDSYLVDNLINQYVEFSKCTNVLDVFYYNLDFYDFSELSMDVRLKMVVNEFLGKNYISAEDFEMTYRKLFGPEVEFEHQDIYLFNKDEGVVPYYIYNGSSYSLNDNHGGFGCTGGDYETKKAYDVNFDEEGNLIASVAVGINIFAGDESFVTNVSVNMEEVGFEGRTQLVKLTGPNGEAFDIDRDYEQLTKYEYNYKYVAEEGYYYLDNITKIK